MRKLALSLLLLVVFAMPAHAAPTIVQCKDAGGSQGQCANASIQTAKLVDGASFITLTGSQILANKTLNCANNTCTVRLGSDVTGITPLANGGTASATGDLVATNNLTTPLLTSTGVLSITSAAGTGASAGSALIITVGAGSTTGAGGAYTARAGQGGATGNGGSTTVLGGAGGSTSGNGSGGTFGGGSATAGNGGGGVGFFSGGSAKGTGTGGLASLLGGAADSTGGPGIGGGATVRAGRGARDGGVGGDTLLEGGIGFSNTVRADGGAIFMDGGAASIFSGFGSLNGKVKIGTKVSSIIEIGRQGGSISLGDGVVTQDTSVTTGVTLNASSGVITTFSQSALAGATSTFTVTNSCVVAGSVVGVTVGNYAGTYGTNGIPLATVSAISAGSFDVTIINGHALNALSGVLKLNFTVL